MKKLVAILKLDGNFESGFQANLELANEGERPYRTISARLPENISIIQLLSKWHNTYCSRYGQFRIKAIQSHSINIESLTPFPLENNQ